jgi:serine/threonine protein kinase
MSRSIGNRYHIVRILDTDASAITYVCRDEQLSDELSEYLVAVKAIRPECASSPEVQAQFRNEILSLRSVANPFVIRLYDHVMSTEVEAYTMEYAAGGDLAELLSEGPLPLPTALTVLRQLSYGLQGIHDAGVMVRGLVPEQIRFAAQGTVKISDFSRAAPLHSEAPLAAVPMPVDYTSPEFFQHNQHDARSDLYALGILAYEMLTGELPFSGDSLFETVEARLNLPECSPEALRPECPIELSDWVMKLLQPDPAKRFQHAGEALQALHTVNVG